MPNSLTATGITTATQPEMLANMTDSIQALYGSDVNLATSTPDGQLMNDFIQAAIDMGDLLTTIFNFFDPDQAVGVILDMRVAINGIQRQAGTFTVTNLTLVTSQSVNLYGLDQTAQPVYTVQDAAGNQWQLQTTQLGVPATTSVFAFQAANPGAVLTVQNTITVPVTIVLGVTSTNNPTTYTTLGVNEESDVALRIRRQASVSIGSQGYLQGLLGALENVPGITSAFVYENNTGAFDGISTDTAYPLGTPGNSIWVIVAGSATSAAVAQAVYQKRNAGCGMRGETSFVITQVDGTPFQILFDTVVTQNLFILFTASSLNGSSCQYASIIAGLTNPANANYFDFGVNQEVNIGELTTYIQRIDPNTLPTFTTSQGFSLSTSGFTNTLTPTLKKNQFTLPSTNIIILPILVTPATASIAPSGSQTFTAVGGYSTYTWTLSVNNSGGSIVSGTGVYTAGSTGSVSDTVLVTDALGNTATAVVTVT